MQECLDVYSEPQFTRAHLRWKYVNVGTPVQKFLLCTYPRGSQQVPSWIQYWRWWSMLINTTISSCSIKRMNPSLPAASETTENDPVVSFWTASWKEGFFTSSQVHLNSFCSIAMIFNTLLFNNLRNNWLTPQFWLDNLRRIRAGVNRINQWRMRKVLFLGNCKVAHFRGTYCSDCFRPVFAVL